MKKIIEWLKIIIAGTLMMIGIFTILLDYTLPIKLIALAVIYISYQAVKDL